MPQEKACLCFRREWRKGFFPQGHCLATYPLFFFRSHFSLEDVFSLQGRLEIRVDLWGEPLDRLRSNLSLAGTMMVWRFKKREGMEAKVAAEKPYPAFPVVSLTKIFKVVPPPASIPESISEDTIIHHSLPAEGGIQQPAEGVKNLAMEKENIGRCLSSKSSRSPKYPFMNLGIQKKIREIPEGRTGLGRRIFRAILGFFALGILRFFYRTALRPWLSGGCRFYPSCSAYGLEALHKHTPLRALGFILGRLARCHPWGPSGYDPVPHASSPETTPTSSSS